jgi:tetratricopeptide (TPR) repeat protein
MTAAAFLLAAIVATEDGSGAAPIREGLAALEAGRHEEAARLLVSAPGLASSYDGLVGLAVARGHMGDLDAAESGLAAAIRLDGRRPEARIERGGLRFLQKRYDEAVSDLRAALRHGDDAYARDLLASSLLLLDRPLEAIESWNRVGQPRLERLTFHGLEHTRDATVRREMRVREGERLDVRALRASLRSLEETGAFSNIRVRADVPRERALELSLYLDERHAFGEPIELASATFTNALVGRARLRYSNLGGRGIGIGAFYRWEGTRPRLDGVVDWPRPFDLPVQMRVGAFRERQPYALDSGEPLTERVRGVDVRFRRVLDGRHSADVTLRWRLRHYDQFHPAAFPGTLIGLEGTFERTFVEGAHARVDALARGFAAPDAFGADADYRSALGAVRYRWRSAPVGPPAVQIVGRALWGLGSRRMPIDQMFAPGAAPDAEYPLRGHRLRENGALGAAPIGRELRLGNLEWRQELWTRPLFGFGLTVFQDVAQVREVVTGSERVLFDLGAGIRIRLGQSPIIRVDYGRDLVGGGSTWTVVVGEPF